MSVDPSNRPPVDYYFEPYRFDGRLRRLYRDSELIVLTPKAADTLVALMERAGRVIEKDELLRAVCGEIVVGDDTLAQNISTLRRMFGDDANHPRTSRSVAAGSGTALALLAVRAKETRKAHRRSQRSHFPFQPVPLTASQLRTT